MILSKYLDIVQDFDHVQLATIKFMVYIATKIRLYCVVFYRLGKCLIIKCNYTVRTMNCIQIPVPL